MLNRRQGLTKYLLECSIHPNTRAAAYIKSRNFPVNAQMHAETAGITPETVLKWQLFPKVPNVPRKCPKFWHIWSGLKPRDYLTGQDRNGKKRCEAFVCTMSEARRLLRTRTRPTLNR